MTEPMKPVEVELGNDLGKLAYDSAAKVTGCTQPWGEANQEKWIAAANAVAFHLADRWGGAIGKSIAESYINRSKK